MLKRSRDAALTRTLLAARRRSASGDHDGPRAALEALGRCREPVIAATALYDLARLHAASGDFEAAVKAAKAGPSRANIASLRSQVSDGLLPALVSELAVAEAALGRTADAEGHLATLARDYPVFPGVPATLVRVRLVEAVSRGDVSVAARVAKGCTLALALSRREELLADLAILAVSADANERARLAADLEEDPALRGWVDRIAPELCDRALTETVHPAR